MKPLPVRIRIKTFLPVFLPPILLAGFTWQAITARPGEAGVFLGLSGIWLLAYTLFLRLWYRRGHAETPWGPMGALFLTGWGILGVAYMAPWAAWRQAVWLLLSVLAFYGFVVLLNMYPALWRKKTVVTLFWCMMGLLALTLVVGQYPGGDQGARLWLGCCGVYLQPAAWHKATTVLYLAWGLMRPFPTWTWWLGLGTTGVLLALQGDLGNLALYFLVALGMFAVHPRWRWRALAGVATLSLVFLWAFHDLPRVQARFLAWWFPQRDPWGIGYQIIQALRAVARGGWWGVGLENLQVVYHVPLVYTDVYYALVAETWGWLGGGMLLVSLSLVGFWALHVARDNGFTMSGLAAWGMAWWWMLQGFWVVGGNLRVVPLTGMPIPFTAYGGSELTAVYAGLGVLTLMKDRLVEAPSPDFWLKTLRLTTWLWGIGVGVLLLAHAWWIIH